MKCHNSHYVCNIIWFVDDLRLKYFTITHITPIPWRPKSLYLTMCSETETCHSVDYNDQFLMHEFLYLRHSYWLYSIHFELFVFCTPMCIPKWEIKAFWILNFKRVQFSKLCDLLIIKRLRTGMQQEKFEVFSVTSNDLQG